MPYVHKMSQCDRSPGCDWLRGFGVVRLAASHEDLEIVLAAGDTNAGKTVASHAPALAALYPGL